jgi:ABC-type oligopeptide transport system substrate-binding subunit
MSQLDRRTFVALGSLSLAGCARDSCYFGKIQPPARQQLICATIGTGDSLDPAKSVDTLSEGSILRALFEGLTNYHPQTMEPMAGIATHYETSADGLRITLFLRGHSRPRGVAFPDTSTLRDEYLKGTLPVDYSRGHTAPPVRVPFRWSDGSLVTAHDVVYSWRRVLDPAMAATYSHLLYCIQYGREVNAGRAPPERLAVRALDEFTLQIDLQAPTAFFLRLLSCMTLAPVPRQAIEAARHRGIENSWTQPGWIVTSGPFTLLERRPRDRTVLRRNPSYIEAGVVGLEEVSFLLVRDLPTSVNLYKSGAAHVTAPGVLPPLLAHSLSGKRDLCTARAFATCFSCFNTTKPPFDNVLVRYAFNMAIDKQAIAGVFGFGRVPARSLVPPLEGYKPPASLVIEIDGRTYNVLDYNPTAARELLSKAGYPSGMDPRGQRLQVDLIGPNFADVRLRCEIFQQQLRANLNVAVNIGTQELQTFMDRIFSGNYRGMADYADSGLYVDPNWFLSEFVTGSSANPTGWADTRYDDMLAKANATIDPATRMQRLAGCEAYLLRAMPFIPIFYDAWAYPQKPYVRGIGPNLIDVHPLKYAWIDTNWRPS